MLLQKTFHVNRTLDQTKARLFALPFCRRDWEGVDRAEFNGRTAKIEFKATMGVTVRAVIEELPSGNPDEILFHSCEGNLAVCGMIEFTSIKERLTEVTLTLDYTLKDLLARFVDEVTGAINGFLNDQLEIIEPMLKGLKEPVEMERPVYGESAPALSICLR